jgi:alpha-tubulin suppressor-like RCC1 family protein
VTPPGPVTSLASVPSPQSVYLSWTNPTDSDLTGVMIRVATGSISPATNTDGTLVGDVSAPATTTHIGGLAPSTTYSFALFAHDAVPNDATPTDLTITTSPAGAGTLYTWGVVGGATVPTPIELAPGVTPTAITAGGADWYAAIGSDHQLYTWGLNDSFQLGDGTQITQQTPERITLAPGVTPTAIAAGDRTGYAIGSDGQLYGWGTNGGNELGVDHATQDEAMTPQVVPLPSGLTPTAVAAGSAFALVLESNHEVYGWGQYGAFGGSSDPDTPQQVLRNLGTVDHPLYEPLTAAAIAAGSNHSFAIGTDGQLFGWGISDGMSGVLGLGAGNSDPYSVPTPVPVPFPGGATAIATNEFTSLGTDAAGNLYTWGSFDDTVTEVGSPTLTTIAPGVTAQAVAASDAGGIVIGSDHNLYAWGYQQPDTPTIIPGIQPTAIAATNGGSSIGYIAIA